ncbi:MAG: tRNA preQ1(34) S-adenosylmethionine ribosyltransferase-isomerase QueA [Candidatus Omnitrophota bacterium]|nr:tRNA preQ1(34) S-adenosylmethionine ribosyltransferase-isomerase QueA [Candidatus Omnitrophota bacterium]
MKLSEFYYELPKELIAQYPALERDKCRMMVLDRTAKTIAHKAFEDIVDYFKPGDLLVLNNTKVIPARLFGKRKSGGKVELFLLDPLKTLLLTGLEKKNPTCEALVKPGARIKDGERIILESGDEVDVLGRGEVGRFVKFNRSLDDILKEIGHVPLPPYIDRGDEESDKQNYQTVYSVNDGATASPTAGLHFTRELLSRVQGTGCRVQYVTLHTNYGTFAPIKTDDIESHKMHREYFELPRETVTAIAETKKSGGKVFAVGTTTTRVLEHCFDKLAHPLTRSPANHSGYTNMFIYPGYRFKVVDRLITNFHLPKSTLMLLVSAFAGKEFIMAAYRQAIAERYRFFSYGDSMVIL